jgi:hypothetical protein
VFAACPDRVMPSASRSLLAAGPDVSRLRDALTALAAEFRAALPRRARMGAEPLSGGQQQLRTHDRTYVE